MLSNCLGVFVGTVSGHNEGYSYITITVIEFSSEEQSLVLFNLLTQVMFYTQPECRPGSGACPSLTDTHTCPPVPYAHCGSPVSQTPSLPSDSPLHPLVSSCLMPRDWPTHEHLHTHDSESPWSLQELTWISWCFQ